MKPCPAIPYETKKKVCKKTNTKGKTEKVKHFVFEDLLDTGENLIAKQIRKDEFLICSYFLLKRSKNVFKKWEENELGCYIGYKKGTPLKFEDFNFLVNNLSDFSLLTEAVEVKTGVIFYFALINICDLPKALTYEVPIKISLLAKTTEIVENGPEKTIIDSGVISLIKLALKGHGKAFDKLEKILKTENISLFLKRIRRHPENFFESVYLHNSKNKYTLIGKIKNVEETVLEETILHKIEIEVENLTFTVITPKFYKKGSRVKFYGRLIGIYEG